MAIAFKKISYEELREHMVYGWQGDDELLKLHIKPGTFDEIVDDTYVRIGEYNDDYEMECYAVMMDDVEIGFSVFIYEPFNMLYSFGIRMQFRKKEILIGWLEGVSNMLGEGFVVPLWLKNIRGIEFFKKNGFVNEVLTQDKSTICLWQ